MGPTISLSTCPHYFLLCCDYDALKWPYYNPGTWWKEARYYSPSHTIPTSLNLCVLTAHLVAFKDLTRLSRTATSTSLCPVWFHCHVGGYIVTWAVTLSRGRLCCHVGGCVVTSLEGLNTFRVVGLISISSYFVMLKVHPYSRDLS